MTKGAAPCAVKVACTVLNGGDEETYRQATRLVPTQRNDDPDIPCLRCQPTPSKLLWISAEVDPMHVPFDDMQKGTEVNLSYPMERLGSHKAWKGHGATRHLQHSALSPML